MPDSESFDSVVLGSGEAGRSIAWHLGNAGQRVAVVEQAYVGGSCPNIACLPSKYIIHSASVARTVWTSGSSGPMRAASRFRCAKCRHASARWCRTWWRRT